MGKCIDLTGKRYGKLLVVRRKGSRNGKAMWECSCDCGNKSIVSTGDLNSGKTQSCGCVKTKHGCDRSGKRTRLYRIWTGMKTRCNNKSDHLYRLYGARGITVCDEWRDSFEAFRDWAQESGYRDDLTIDRINVDGNYDPGNCRWATRKEQMHNTRRCHYITVDGVTKDLTQWAQTIGLSTGAIGWAIQSGKDPAEYIKEKMQERGGNIE